MRSPGPKNSNPILDAVRDWQYPEFAEERGTAKVVAFGDHSHKCPIYVRKVPPCTAGCPAGNDIRAWLTIVQQTRLKNRSWQESYELAWHEASRTTPFPATCGRVCPAPCETRCNRTQKDDSPVNIAAFERWLGDYGIRHGLRHQKLTEAVREKKVAVIGAGPAGLSCAFQLARRGYPVTVFEALPQPGGMLRYGIPAFRLPRPILDAEIAAISQLGVEIVCNTTIGQDKDLAALQAGFDAIFVGIGAQAGMGLAGEGLEAANVVSGVAFLHQVNAGQEVAVGDQVVVVGGGNTAITAARVARRLGAQVTMLYRRTRAEMPTLEREIDDALVEGVDIRYLVAPVGVRNENGRAVAVRCQGMELGAPDASGRRRALPIAGSHFEVPCTTVITAISQRPDWGELTLPWPTDQGWLRPDAEWSVGHGIYAGGDVITLALVTTAIGHGRKAAEQIAAQLSGERLRPATEGPIATADTLRLEYYPELHRNERAWVPAAERCAQGLALEADLGLSEGQVQAEAKRCMSCGLCFECRQCLIFCPQTAISALPHKPTGEVMYTDYNRCVGCHICAQACPSGYIQMGMGDGL